MFKLRGSAGPDCIFLFQEEKQKPKKLHAKSRLKKLTSKSQHLFPAGWNCCMCLNYTEFLTGLGVMCVLLRAGRELLPLAADTWDRESGGSGCCGTEGAALELLSWVLFKTRKPQGVIFNSGSDAAVCKAVKSSLWVDRCSSILAYFLCARWIGSGLVQVLTCAKYVNIWTRFKRHCYTGLRSLLDWFGTFLNLSKFN